MTREARLIELTAMQLAHERAKHIALRRFDSRAFKQAVQALHEVKHQILALGPAPIQHQENEPNA